MKHFFKFDILEFVFHKFLFSGVCLVRSLSFRSLSRQEFVSSGVCLSGVCHSGVCHSGVCHGTGVPSENKIANYNNVNFHKTYKTVEKNFSVYLILFDLIFLNQIIKEVA